jgi:hypothetical protein
MRLSESGGPWGFAPSTVSGIKRAEEGVVLASAEGNARNRALATGCVPVAFVHRRASGVGREGGKCRQPTDTMRMQGACAACAWSLLLESPQWLGSAAGNVDTTPSFSDQPFWSRRARSMNTTFSFVAREVPLSLRCPPCAAIRGGRVSIWVIM